MRIGLLIYGSLDTLSGGYLYDRQLVQAWRAAGHSVEIVSLPWRNYTRHLGDNWWYGFYQQLRNLPVDVLIQDELNHPSLWWLNQRLRHQVDYPLVSLVHHLRSSEHHPALARLLYRWVERRYLNTVDVFIYNSQTTRNTVEPLLAKPRPSLVAYPAGDHLSVPSAETLTALLPARSHSSGPLRVLFVGTVMPRKGLHTLLAALARLPADHCTLTVVGSLTTVPDYVAACRRLVAQHNLQGRVHFTGALSDAELVAHYASHHLLAVPSYEGFGIVYLEAMAHGLPVIASTAGAAHEIVIPGENGWLIKPGDAATLANHLAALQQQRDLLLRMGQAARQRYAQQPTWVEGAKRILLWLHEVKQRFRR